MRRFFHTGLGVGDVLLVSGLIRAWRRVHDERVGVLTLFPELFKNHPDVVWTFNERKYAQFVSNLQIPIIWRIGSILNQWKNKYRIKATYPFPCWGKHLIEAMAESIELSLLSEEKRPFLYLTNTEKLRQNWASNWIVVQSSSTNYWTVNKHWVSGRMQGVVDELKRMGYDIVHLGSKEDEPLQNVTDLRDKTTLREAAAIMANAQLFVGLEGGLVHLAKSVGRQAVVIYTGYTLPEETGYADNINLRDPGAGGACWKREECEHCLNSAKNITVDQVIETLKMLLI